MLVDHKYPDFQLIMKVYLCSSSNRNLTLKEHISCRWLDKKKIENLDWAEADIPIVKRLLTNRVI